MYQVIKNLNINLSEIFYSIQGEARDSGRPCIFIRTSGCSLRCTYCDTKYAWEFKNPTPISEIVKKISDFPTKLVLITGGEPLEDPNIGSLLEALLIKNYEVIIETGGHISIENLPKEISCILDIKTPDSGESEKNHLENLTILKKNDQVKFVICSETDYQWSKEFIRKNLKNFEGEIFFSPAFSSDFSLKQLAESVLRDGLPIKIQQQLHKSIWGQKRGY